MEQRTTDGSAGLFPTPPWIAVLAGAGALLVTGFVILAALTAVPPVAANLSSETSDGRTPMLLDSGTSSAHLLVPEGWVILREGPDALVARTPDGVLAARVDLPDLTPEQAIVAGAGGDTPTRIEALPAGLTMAHADIAGGGVVAVVSVGETNVRIVAELRSASDAAADPDAYRPAIAQLIGGVGR